MKFGLFPNPKRSVRNNMYLNLIDLEKFGNNVSVQNADDDINP